MAKTYLIYGDNPNTCDERPRGRRRVKLNQHRLIDSDAGFKLFNDGSALPHYLRAYVRHQREHN